MTELNQPPLGLGKTISTDRRRALHARRYGSETRFKLLGLSAVLTSVLFLVFLLYTIVGSGIPFGIFTRNSREAASLMLETMGIGGSLLVAREDAAAKPNPEGILKIARQFQLAPGDMLCVGDFFYDLQATRSCQR